jgi:hypothetical protein
MGSGLTLNSNRSIRLERFEQIPQSSRYALKKVEIAFKKD